MTKQPKQPQIPVWTQDAHGRLTAKRAAEFWKPLPGGAIACSLCYRNCVLQRGETGWCDYRTNINGRMTIPDHGVLSSMQRQMLGFRGGIRLFYPGARALALGGTRCTAACSFCASSNAVHRPEALPWLGGRERGLGYSGGWHYVRSMAHPSGVIAMAKEWGARAIVFADNEPLLSFEYTADVARLAKQAGLAVIIYTNGFATPAAITKLGPYVDCVDLGVKGSLDEVFYTRHMRSPGATAHVKAAALAWKQTGALLILSNLIPAQHMQDDAAHTSAQAELHTWIRDALGALTPLFIGPMVKPALARAERPPLLGETPFIRGRAESDLSYSTRVAAAVLHARSVGLAYAHQLEYSSAAAPGAQAIHCHSCGSSLLDIIAPACCGALVDGRCAMFHHYCDCWSTALRVARVDDRGGRCVQCGADVPIVPAPGA